MRPNAKNKDTGELNQEILTYVAQLGEATAHANAHGIERPDVAIIACCLKLEAAGRLESLYDNNKKLLGW
jgi:hypothetical protein